MVESVYKLRNKMKERPGWVTIHDVLAFNCGFCGHSSVNRYMDGKGKICNIGNHGMGECSKVCCGVFLDRRTLQYETGECECGVEVMRMLGIRSATQGENRWRWKLYIINPPPAKKRELGIILNPHFASMSVKKPFMLIWYLLAKGDEIIGELKRMAKADIERYLWQVIRELGQEFQVHRPIQ